MADAKPVDMESLLREVDLDPQGRWVSPKINRLATAPLPGQPDTVVIRDDTLRSGLNTPGVYVDLAGRLELAEKLAAVGVQEAEVGYASLDDHLEFVRALKARGLPLKLGLHTRYYDPDYRREISRAVEAGADLVNLVGYWSYVHTQALCPDLWGGIVEERVYDAAQYARSLGATVAVGTDYHRLDLAARAVAAARAAGAHRMVVYDARGWFVPQTLAFLVRFVRALAGSEMEIQVHCHDDYGLATINTIEAVRAGARYCDVTINSTGHRCGNAALEQVVPALEALYGIRTGIDLAQLCSLSALVERLFGVPVAANAPIVGRHMYSYGGSHIGGILRGEWYFWENIRAEAVGNRRTITFGPTALRRGRTGPLAVKAEVMGYDPSDPAMERVYEALEPLLRQKRELTEAEVEAVIHQVFGGA